jgi:ubiquinone/menaquinone biosynthesis C-methylase UbiE
LRFIALGDEMKQRNMDPKVVSSFGDEWSTYDQQGLDANELREMFEAYFSIFPWDKLPPNASGFDMGCGSGRWAKLVAPRVGDLHCIDPSPVALRVAKRNLAPWKNCVFHLAGVDDIPLEDASADFGYSLGVLHHVPDTAAAICSCARKLKPGAPFLVYLYFAFDNKPMWYYAIWRMSDLVRIVLARVPFRIRLIVSQIIALFVYWPLARIARVAEALGADVDSLPLSTYRSRSFYTMRTDALDRFGTRLEQRFSRRQIADMLQAAGFRDVTFSNSRPYWCALAFKQPY